MNGWQVSLSNMSIDSTSSNLSLPVPETAQIAVISSPFPWIGLPDRVAERIHKAIGMKHVFDWIDCDKREHLPNWTIVFGPHGQSITLTPWDYLIEFYDRYFVQLKCVSAFLNLSELGEKGFIILGSSFFNGLHNVFDADRGTILFSNRPL
jgi:hypothetical protein